MTTLKINPYKAVDYKESSIESALEAAGSLIADVKYDGVRGELIIEPSKGYNFLSRVSKEVPALAYLKETQSERWDKFLNDDRQLFPQGLLIDGELMIKDVDFNTSSGLLRTKWLKETNQEFDEYGLKLNSPKKTPFCLDLSRLEMVIYAVVPIDIIKAGSDKDYPVMNCIMQTHTDVTVRLLREYFPEIDWKTPETYDVFSMNGLKELYELMRSEGHEGLVVKDPWGIYKRGKKTGWWKMKPEDTIDGTVCGLVWGTVGKANEGKVIGFEVLLEDGMVVNACGLTQEQMTEFTGNCCPEESLFKGNYYHGYQVEVQFMERFPDGSLRHPSFKCFRGTEDNPTVKI
ncbi:MAG: hypothetical protein [Caudoviricetes sp.]|nr:MAG: hypothetical protein [Caudoviricetes sp.]